MKHYWEALQIEAAKAKEKQEMEAHNIKLSEAPKVIEEMGRPPSLVAIQNFVQTPQMMGNINYAHRLQWRVNNVLCKVMHELFLALSGDVVVIKGTHADLQVFNLVADLLGTAQWACACARGPLGQGTVLVVSDSSEELERAFAKELGIYEGPLERADGEAAHNVTGTEAGSAQTSQEGGKYAKAAARALQGSAQDSGSASETVSCERGDALVTE